MNPHRKKRIWVIAAVVAYLPALALLMAVGLIQIVKGIPAGHITRDIAATASVPFYTGAISTIGILLWCATAAICFFTTAVLASSKAGTGPRAFVLQSGLLTTVLLVDDAFMIHENAPRLFGVSDNVVFLVYGVLALYVFYSNMSFVGETARGLLALSLSLLAAAVLFDELHDYRILQQMGIASSGVRYLLEDGFKFLGITGWFVYYGWTCFVLVNPGWQGKPGKSGTHASD